MFLLALTVGAVLLCTVELMYYFRFDAVVCASRYGQPQKSMKLTFHEVKKNGSPTHSMFLVTKSDEIESFQLVSKRLTD